MCRKVRKGFFDNSSFGLITSGSDDKAAKFDDATVGIYSVRYSREHLYQHHSPPALFVK